METLDRRKFLRDTGATAAGMAVAAPFIQTGMAQSSPNETINVAVMGIRSRGRDHIRNFCGIPNVRVKTLCDPDANLFAERVAEVEKLTGQRPGTETDIRRVCEDKDIDVISIASQNHWHSLAGIWACQAGKDAYVEKPISHNIFEGRKLVEAARRYDRIVQTGTQRRSSAIFKAGMEFLHSGELGDPYMVRLLIFRPRESIGRGKVVPIPEGVDFDKWLGPAPWRAFVDNRFHYNWHWFWDIGNGETGNNGPHSTDVARWALRKYDHPQRIQSLGGYYVFDCDQETPNTQTSVLQYADGTLLHLDVRNLYTNREGCPGASTFIYGGKGWMQIDDEKWETFYGRKNEPGPSMNHAEALAKYGLPGDIPAGDDMPHFLNFIEAVRAHDRKILNAEILEGHLSTSICHLCNIAYRTGRTLNFDSETETFVADEVANRLVRREYRYPYIVPEEV